MELNQEIVKELFEYKDGHLYWKVNRGPKKKGEPVSCKTDKGYFRVGLFGKTYRVHRLIYLLHHGYLPNELDHIDGNRSNNRIENLREATKSQNQYNKGIQKNNTSGVKGVWFDKVAKKWSTQLFVKGKKFYFGYFDSLEEAKKVIETARNNLHKEFANHGS